MARPIKEGLDYFSHDVDAVNDEKIEALRMLYKNDGYAFYFILLERIYRTSNFELDISDAETIQILSKKIGITVDEFNSMLKTSLKYGCFDRDTYDTSKLLTSKGIKKRANVVIEKRVKMQEYYKNKQSNISVTEMIQETQPKTPQSKEKNSIEKQDIYCSFFQSIWALYPNKKGKGQVSLTQKKKLFSIGFEELSRCINRYKQSKEEWKQWQNGSTFFNSGYIDFLDANFTEEKTNQINPWEGMRG